VIGVVAGKFVVKVTKIANGVGLQLQLARGGIFTARRMRTARIKFSIRTRTVPGRKTWSARQQGYALHVAAAGASEGV
jgi:hypothetical protein